MGSAVTGKDPIGRVSDECTLYRKPCLSVVCDADSVLDTGVLEQLSDEVVGAFVSVVPFPSGGDFCVCAIVRRCLKADQPSRIIDFGVPVAQDAFCLDSLDDVYINVGAPSLLFTMRLTEFGLIGSPHIGK